jgi:hypothetical protein
MGCGTQYLELRCQHLISGTRQTKLGLNENLANVHMVSDISKKDYLSCYPVNPLSIQIQTQFYQLIEGLVTSLLTSLDRCIWTRNKRDKFLVVTKAFVTSIVTCCLLLQRSFNSMHQCQHVLTLHRWHALRIGSVTTL